MGAPVALSATPNAFSYLHCGPHTPTIAPGTSVSRSAVEIAPSSWAVVPLSRHQAPASPDGGGAGCAQAGLTPNRGASTRTLEVSTVATVRRRREPCAERALATMLASTGTVGGEHGAGVTRRSRTSSASPTSLRLSSAPRGERGGHRPRAGRDGLSGRRRSSHTDL